MSVNSVHTNSAALIALQALNRTSQELENIQTHVSTGYRVASAKDDGAAFSIAQGLRGDQKGYEAISEQMSKAKGLMSVANDSAKQLSDSLGDIRAIITKLADENVSGDERAQYIADYNNQVAQLTRYVSNASFNGVNMLNNTTGVKVISNLTGGTLTLNSFDIPTNVIAKLTTITTPASAQALLVATTGGLSVAESNLGTAMAQMGADTKSLENQINYVGVLADATESGVGAIVDADLAKESAKLQSLQIRQQLGSQTLSIANQSPNILLSLFKN